MLPLANTQATVKSTVTVAPGVTAIALGFKPSTAQLSATPPSVTW
jgi:hypothetical protein